jgi:hypothetical protein
MLAVVLGSWVLAGLRAGSLPYAATPRQLYGRAGRVLALIGVGLVLIVVRVSLVGALAPAGWFVHEQVVLSLPLLLVAATATAVASVPRLLALRAAARAFNGVDGMPPSLRHEAAHPLVAWPLQLTAYVAAASEIVFFLVSYPATAGSSFAVVTGVGLAGVVTWRLLARRHARLAADVIVPRRRIRLIRSAAAVTGLGLAAVAIGLLALVLTAPPATAQDGAGHLLSTVDAVPAEGSPDGSGWPPATGSGELVERVQLDEFGQVRSVT